ncbi:MAG: AbrB/MazE/SpoVT family DNA-binding domain-containing protein [Verrucomicrobiota bacterium]
MVVKLTHKRQVTFPKEVCRRLGLKPGSRVELVLRNHGREWLLKPLRLRKEKLAPLRGKLKKGRGTFDMEAFRAQKKNYARLRH